MRVNRRGDIARVRPSVSSWSSDCAAVAAPRWLFRYSDTRSVGDTRREWYRVWRDARLAAGPLPLNACRFRPGWPARHRGAASLAADAPLNAVLGRQVLILQQEFLVDQTGHVGQKPRACGCVRPQRHHKRPSGRAKTRARLLVRLPGTEPSIRRYGPAARTANR